MPRPTFRPCPQCATTYDRSTHTRCPQCEKRADEPTRATYAPLESLHATVQRRLFSFAKAPGITGENVDVTR